MLFQVNLTQLQQKIDHSFLLKIEGTPYFPDSN